MISDICLIGDVVIDITLNHNSEDKMRLGGILHAARCLWAFDSSYSIAFFCPEYLEKSIAKFALEYGNANLLKLGNVIGSPNVFFINEAKEIGDQGYNFVLRNEIEIQNNKINFDKLKSCSYKDVLFISGNYSINEVLPAIDKDANIHLDIANNVEDVTYLDKFDRILSTIFISTSSTLFQKFYKDDFLSFANLFKQYTRKLVLKENRGGSRAIDFEDNKILSIPAQTKPIVHSVGVGDVYDACYVLNYNKKSFEESLILSSWVAAEYASTTYPEDFKSNTRRTINSSIGDLIELGGICIPWEKRGKINIYIAAPDFDYINSKYIDLLCNSLLYHNFTPRRPIKENGQMEKDASNVRKNELFSKDIQMINECQILVAVLLNNDPGTLIEIGIGATKGIPTFVYDPHNLAENCMLTQIPNLVSGDLDEIIAEVFISASNQITL